MPARLFQIVEQVIAFGVDVGAGMVRELARRVTEADPFVEDGSSNPNGPAIGGSDGGTPETHVMAFAP